MVPIIISKLILKILISIFFMILLDQKEITHQEHLIWGMEIPVSRAAVGIVLLAAVEVETTYLVLTNEIKSSNTF